VIVRPASSLAQDRESSPVKDQRSTTVLRRKKQFFTNFNEFKNSKIREF